MEVGNSNDNNNNSSSCIMMMENNNNNNNNNNNGILYPMIMIPHHHHQHNNNNQSHNSSSHHFINSSSNYNINENNYYNFNNNKSRCCNMIPHHHHQNSAVTTGYYDHHQQHQNQNQNQNHQLMEIMGSEAQDHHHQHDDDVNNNNNGVTVAINSNNNGGGSSNGNIKAKIMAHPHYPRLLSAFVSCQKVGAPPEVVARLEETEAMVMNHTSGRGGGGGGSYVGEDPALDQFMEAYCEMLTKYEQELTKPFKEAMLFLSRVESQFKALTLSSPPPSDSPSSACGEVPDRNGSSEEDIDVNNNFIDPSAEDRELKGQLLRKYSGYLGSLRQEFLKKRKKGKLPKEARQQLLDWWSRHYKWPYPSESQKLALAESTGLDQKQINNWFINQRKRHWKPSEDMQFVVMDAAAHSHPHLHYGYMDNVLGNPFPMDVSPTLM